jgi:adenylate kinase family enzyme
MLALAIELAVDANASISIPQLSRSAQAQQLAMATLETEIAAYIEKNKLVSSDGIWAILHIRFGDHKENWIVTPLDYPTAIKGVTTFIATLKA